MTRFVIDPMRMPRSGETPAERLARAVSLAGTPGQAYVERRGIPLAVADCAGLRFDPDWNGRPAVLVGLYDRADELVSVHGRYLSTLRGHLNSPAAPGDGDGRNEPCG